jgi:predicted amidophosphoribosyltransferase
VIRAIAYASCYVYSPAGAGEMCERSRLLRTFLKAGDETFIRRYARRVCQEARSSPLLSGFFGPTDLLVPVPGSLPHNTGNSWASQHLALALVKEGLGGAAWAGLHRVRAVRKSATAAPGTRPTVSLHYESFYVERPTEPPEGIVLIDDVITKGRTLLAAASRIQEAFPGVQIRAFALLRTMGLVSEVEQLLDPCKGQIRWKGGDAHRSP